MKDTLWTEKYRPAQIQEMKLPEDVSSLLKRFLEERSPPNLLLYGPPGGGKTSLALILSKHHSSREDILELNASSEREISVIRGKIKEFASTKPHSSRIRTVIMDEADYLTPDAQHCLRRIIEDTQKSTRFIFITNYISRIIDPIKSRLSSLRIPPADRSTSISHLLQIKDKENLPIPNTSLDFLIDTVHGDLRRAITLLQSVGPLSLPENHLRILIQDLSSSIPEDAIRKCFSVKSVAEILEVTEYLVREGYSSLSLLRDISRKASSLPHKTKHLLSLMVALSEIEEASVQGAQEYIQISSILSEVSLFNLSL